MSRQQKPQGSSILEGSGNFGITKGSLYLKIHDCLEPRFKNFDFQCIVMGMSEFVYFYSKH